jgi:YbbR domain-containing protein
MTRWLRTTGLRIVLSLGLAVALWLYVTYTENPDTTATFGDVPVQIEGVSPGLVVVNPDGTPRTNLPVVDVTAAADAQTVRSITRSDLKAFVDMSGRGPGEHVVPVLVDTRRTGLARVRFSAEPANESIRLEEVITATVPLTIEVTGNVPFSYERGEPVITFGGVPITTAQVSGPRGLVEQVARAQVTADIDRLTANYSSSRALVALTSGGEEVRGVTINPATVEVLVPIRSSVGIKRVPIVPRVTGAPATGYQVAGVKVEPQFVTLTGSAGPLDAVQNVPTKEVSIDGANTTVVRTVDLEVPPDVVLEQGEPSRVQVTVQIAPVSGTFRVTLPVPVQMANIPPGLLASLSPQVVQVPISGPAAQLAQLDASSLAGTVSLSGLGPGTYTLTPTITLPSGLSFGGPVPQVTVTLRAPATATPQQTETPAPTQAPEATQAPTQEPPSPTPAATPARTAAPGETPAPTAAPP